MTPDIVVAIFCGASGFCMSAFLLLLIFKDMRHIDKKYTYINEIFKQYLDAQRKDDKE